MLKYLSLFLFIVAFAMAGCQEPEDGFPPPDNGQPPPPQDPQVQDPAMGQVEEVEDEELEEFATVILKAERDGVDPQMDYESFSNLVEDSELEMERFEQINFAIQQDPELQQDIQQLFAELQDEIL